MPHLTFTGWAVWIFIATLQPTAAAAIIARGLFKEWQSAFYFLSLCSLRTFALMAIACTTKEPLQSWLYFYTYWSSCFIEEALLIWIMIQISCHTGGISKRARYCIYLITPATATAFFLAFWQTSPSEHATLYPTIVYAVASAYRAISLGWLLTFLVISFSAELLGLTLLGFARYLSIGTAIICCNEVITSWLLKTESTNNLLSMAHTGLFSLAISVWIAGTLKREPTLNDLPPLNEIHNVISKGLSAVQKVRS